MVNAFMTDPGSYWRLTAGLVKRAGSVAWYALASKDGKLARPTMAPVLTFITRPVAPTAWFLL